MQLYSYFRSSAAYRVRIALNLKGIPYSLAPVNLLEAEQRNEAYRALNPQGLVPALQLECGTVLNQSTAILEWLEDTFPDTPLLPADPLDRARVRSLCNHIACEIHPLNNIAALNYLKRNLGQSESQVHRWYSHWVQRAFEGLEFVVKDGTGKFCHGGAPSLAECYLVPQMFNARRFKVDLSAYPVLCSIVDHCNTLEAFHRAAPEQQPDATGVL